MRRSLRSWLLGSHIFVFLLPVLVVVGTGILAAELRKQTQVELENQAALLELLVLSSLDAHPKQDLHALAPGLTPLLVKARERTLAGIRIVDHDGIVVASSGDELGDFLGDRQEVRAALEGAVALETRAREAPSRNPLGSASRRATVRLYLGVPIRIDDRTVGAVVLSRTPREEVQALYQALPWWAMVLPLVLTMVTAQLAGRGFSRSLVQLAETSRRISEGDFTATAGLDRPARSRVREVGELATAFAAMTGRLQERLGYISEFAGNVSHEFKTPIATLRGTVELLRDDPDMPAPQRERFLTNATAELLRLEQLVTGLLTLARAEERQDRTTVDLDSLAATTADRYAIEVVGSAGAVRANAGQLQVAVDNLVENALRYGGDEVQVGLTLQRTEAEVLLTVTDDGPGIAAANLPRIFDRFFTTARGQGGTGLGLALVRTIAVAHGGQVDVRSSSAGTSFCIRLPH